jgi:DisA bacterial checkpoint controller nucleotide-binding
MFWTDLLMTHRLHSYLGYSYPAQLAELVKKVWPAEGLDLLPGDSQLRLLVDVAYHASLLREEQRPVTFRLLAVNPADVIKPDLPPLSVAGFQLDRARPFNEQEVRRISMAADFFRSLIGVYSDAEEQLKIWGILLSGTRWVNAVDGGRFSSAPLPRRMVIHALGPGRLTVFLGHQRVAALSSGQLEANAFDLFQSNWLAQSFRSVRAASLKSIYSNLDLPYVPLNAEFLRVISQNVLRRTLSVVRDSKHGGTLVFIEPDEEPNFIASKAIRFKYRLSNEEQRSRYRTLLSAAFARLAHLEHQKKITDVGWMQYQSVADHELSDLDEAFFEFAHFLADLMAVDGALILTKRYEIVGFGAELRSEAPRLSGVRRAMDPEAEIWANEPLDDVGTRHRAVYRLCDQHPNCVAIVISQDGSVRFVKNHNGAVTYWNQLSW